MVRLLAVGAVLVATLAWTAGCDVDCEVCCEDGDFCVTMEGMDKGDCEDCTIGDEMEDDLGVAGCKCEAK